MVVRVPNRGNASRTMLPGAALPGIGTREARAEVTR